MTVAIIDARERQFVILGQGLDLVGPFVNRAETAADEAQAATAITTADKIAAASSAATSVAASNTAVGAKQDTETAAANALATQAAIELAVDGIVEPIAIMAATRTILAGTASVSEGATAFLGEGSRAGLFIWRDEVDTALIAIDQEQGVYVAPTSDTTGASGAWERVNSDTLRIEWFGGAGFVTKAEAQTFDNIPAWNAMAAFIVGENITPVVPFYRGGRPIQFGQLVYYFSDTIEPRWSGHMFGHGTSMGNSSSGSTLLFAQNKLGVSFPSYFTTGNGEEEFGGVTTVGAAGDDPATAGADGFQMHGLRVESLGGNDPTAHGILARCRASIRHCRATNFPGDGCRIIGGDSTADASGNANCGTLADCSFNLNGQNGLTVIGGDANAWEINNVDTTKNGRWGKFLNAFLSLDHHGGHSQSNGIKGVGNSTHPNPRSSMVHYAGNRYYLQYQQEALAGSTTPGTNEAVWGWLEVGPTEAVSFPEWEPGATYFVGGDRCCPNPSSPSRHVNCYAEGGQGPRFLRYGQLDIGGTNGAGYQSSSTGSWDVVDLAGSVLYSRGVGSKEALPGTASSNNNNHLEVIAGGNVSIGQVLRVRHPTLAPANYRLRFNGPDLSFNYANSDSFLAFRITGPTTAYTFGRSNPVPHALNIEPFIGRAADARRVSNGTAAPTTGEAGRGDWIINRNGSPGAPILWRCTTAGTPGAWDTVHVTSHPGLAGVNTLGNVNANLTFGTSKSTHRWNSPINADRTATLLRTGAVDGAKFRIDRTAAAIGSFNLTVRDDNAGAPINLGTVAIGEWMDVEFDGTAWIVTARGSL